MWRKGKRYYECNFREPEQLISSRWCAFYLVESGEQDGKELEFLILSLLCAIFFFFTLKHTGLSRRLFLGETDWNESCSSEDCGGCGSDFV